MKEKKQHRVTTGVRSQLNEGCCKASIARLDKILEDSRNKKQSGYLRLVWDYNSEPESSSTSPKEKYYNFYLTEGLLCDSYIDNVQELVRNAVHCNESPFSKNTTNLRLYHTPDTWSATPKFYKWSKDGLFLISLTHPPSRLQIRKLEKMYKKYAPKIFVSSEYVKTENDCYQWIDGNWKKFPK